MVELTEAAKAQLDGYFAEQERSPIRVFMKMTGWCEKTTTPMRKAKCVAVRLTGTGPRALHQ